MPRCAELNDGARKINTIEDPIEFAVDGLRQSQVNPAIELGFPELLRSVLRQIAGRDHDRRDPRRRDRADRGARGQQRASSSSRRCTRPTAAGAVQAMRSLGAHPALPRPAACRGVVAQRLVRTLCPKCRQTFDLSDAPHMFEEVRPWLRAEEGTCSTRARRVRECGMTGYAGQTGVFEVMNTSPAVRTLIAEGHTAPDIRAQGGGRRNAAVPPGGAAEGRARARRRPKKSSG